MKDSYYLAVIVFGFALLFVVSLLLEWSFIQERVVRQIVVYVLMLLICFVMFKLLFNGKKN